MGSLAMACINPGEIGYAGATSIYHGVMRLFIVMPCSGNEASCALQYLGFQAFEGKPAHGNKGS